MKFAIIGSRSIKDPVILDYVLTWYRSKITLVISGGATGVDTMAAVWALKHGFHSKVILPDWKAYGKSAGPIRNKEIVEAAEKIVAIWDGKSRGTMSAVDHARKIARPVDLWLVSDDDIGLLTEYPVWK